MFRKSTIKLKMKPILSYFDYLLVLEVDNTIYAQRFNTLHHIYLLCLLIYSKLHFVASINYICKYLEKILFNMYFNQIYCKWVNILLFLYEYMRWTIYAIHSQLSCGNLTFLWLSMEEKSYRQRNILLNGWQRTYTNLK